MKLASSQRNVKYSVQYSVLGLVHNIDRRVFEYTTDGDQEADHGLVLAYERCISYNEMVIWYIQANIQERK